MRLTYLGICLFFIIRTSFAQPDAGNYVVTGKFYFAVTTIECNQVKMLTQISPGRYQVEIGNVGLINDFFQFDVDANNLLINWVAVGNTPLTPASGFMQNDNPGNFSFAGNILPGGFPFIHSNFANRYDPIDGSIYFHYGFGSGSTNENGFNNQFYEKWVRALPAPVINTFTPANATFFTPVTITGKYFSIVDSSRSVAFGGLTCDSMVIISDTVIKAWPGNGYSGNVSATSAGRTTNKSGFIYTNGPASVDSQWHFVGTPGFTPSYASYINLACSNTNIPYVVYVDSGNVKCVVMKYSLGSWTQVGPFVSDGTCSLTNIAVDNLGRPIVAYRDSLVNGRITVKRFDGINWQTLGAPGFGIWMDNYLPISIDIDNTNAPYVLSVDSSIINHRVSYDVSLFKFNGSAWVNVGTPGFVSSAQGQVSMAVDKNSGMPYVVFDDFLTGPGISPSQASVMKFNGSTWVYLGAQRIPSGKEGLYEPHIAFGNNSIPYISFIDGNGFDRYSVYRFNAGSWNPVGNTGFTKGRTFYSGLTVDRANDPILTFWDYSFYGRASVMKFTNASSTSWEYAGGRGFMRATAYGYNRHSIVTDTNNIPMIAFSDARNGNRITVMSFTGNTPVHDSICGIGTVILPADVHNPSFIYKWQVDTGLGFTDLVNGANYNGTSSDTLKIISPPRTWYGYKYRCIAQGVTIVQTGVSHVLHFTNRWISTGSTTWEDPANWSCGVLPDENTDVIINSGNVVISSNVIIRTLTITPGVLVTVSTGFNLTVLH